MSDDTSGTRLTVRGTVQGVGFRPWVYHLARDLSLVGTVRNDAVGVTIDVWGTTAQIERLIERLGRELPRAARIDGLVRSELVGRPPVDFRIIDSEIVAGATLRRASIPADLGTCDECVAEIFDPKARRFRYPFTNCTHCGPRYSIVTAVPYDRPKTTMAGFPMCVACRREYEDPDDRRFHAQPIACPACGPRLSLLTAHGDVVVTSDRLRTVAEALREGSIVALKGLGGYHLACDASRDDVVAVLRARKQRDAKPFAVMVPSLAAAHALARLSPSEEAMLTSAARPIVIADSRPGAVAPSVCPDPGRIGLMLPYTPLHHLLLADFAGPLVMTSGNRGDEPMVYEDSEALDRLSGIADLLLLHDRPIASRVDDSVGLVIDGKPRLIRRARGYVPDPIRLPAPLAEPVLAVGGQLKNTFCLGVGDLAYLGPHIGDLDHVESLASLRQSIDQLESFLDVRPQVVACDLHPDYQSTRYAQGRGARRLIAVQHHHAHIASLMAETGQGGPVLGVAFDGTGYGPDGNAWGGEILLASAGTYERLATLRPLRLAGGEQAIAQVWRLALAACLDAGLPPAELDAHLPALDPVAVDNVAALVRAEHGVLAHGAGRWFDAVGALVLGRSRADYEGQIAIALELAAAQCEDPCSPYPYAIERGQRPWQIDLRPTLRAIVNDLREGRPRSAIAAAFHQTVAVATAEVVGGARQEHGSLPVLLSGGCFYNRRLSDSLREALGAGVRVVEHSRVPSGDGGLALGQLAVAAAHLAAQDSQESVDGQNVREEGDSPCA